MMALTLSLQPAKHTFSDYPYQDSSTWTNNSTGTLRHYACRQISISSQSVGSIPKNSLQTGSENSRAAALSKSYDVPVGVNDDTLNASHAFNDRTTPGRHSANSSVVSSNSFRSALEDKLTIGQSSGVDYEASSAESPDGTRDKIVSNNVSWNRVAFKRWISTLRRRKYKMDQRNASFNVPSSITSIHGIQKTESPDETLVRGDHRQSSSTGGSTDLVTGVRSMSGTKTNLSIMSRSWATIGLGRSAGPKIPATRSSQRSPDSTSKANMSETTDSFAWARGVQRRKILEELIESEESYVGDLKVLVNVYFTLLASTCSISQSTRASIRENVAEILQMHEALLGELHGAIPHSEYAQRHAKESTGFQYLRGHVRWHSADDSPISFRQSRFRRTLRHSVDCPRPTQSNPIATTADPETVIDVARVFERFLNRLLVYEEYGVKYEMMVQDLAATYKTLPAAEAFQKGVEVLSRTLESVNNQVQSSKKALSYNDLLIKPIQRVCKYHLFFADLSKQTPVIDSPDAHALLVKVQSRLKEANHEINKATNDPDAKSLMEKTWLLQDRLKLPFEISQPLYYRLLGHVKVCGVLHVAYQGTCGIKGQYMLCVLFKSFLILAVNDKGQQLFEVVASIPLCHLSLEEADNGRGLQCHTAPFSWKVVFELDHRLFELLFSACSQAEEERWRQVLTDKSSIENTERNDITTAMEDACSSLTLDLRPVGKVYYQSKALVRHSYIRRAATLGSKSSISQVVIKNTESLDQGHSNTSDPPLLLGRSQSTMGCSFSQILAPRRSERMNLELALSDVWTKDVLPFPGMKPAESMFKASATHVIRKLSMASIASSFSKRTSSYVNLPKPMARVSTPVELNLGTTSSPTPKPLMARRPLPQSSLHKTSCSALKNLSFHKNPEAFLPPDFELKDPRASKLPKHPMTIRPVDDAQASISEESLQDWNCPQSATGLIPRATVDENKAVASSHTELFVAKRKVYQTANENTKHSLTNKTELKGRENIQPQNKSMRPITKQLRRLFN